MTRNHDKGKYASQIITKKWRYPLVIFPPWKASNWPKNLPLENTPITKLRPAAVKDKVNKIGTFHR
jgi:hypothetical protein